MELKNLGQTAASALIHTDIRLEREHWTMFRNKLLGIAAAATLGTAAMLGSTAVHAALKICDDSGPADTTALKDDCFDSVTFAAEALAEDDERSALDKSDTTKYYDIEDTLVLAAPSNVAAQNGDVYFVNITLDGMVFQGIVAQGGLGTSYEKDSGGLAGDDKVRFRLKTVTSGTGGVLATGVLALTASYAVSAAGGSATLTMENRTTGDESVTHKGSVIKVAPALKETATKTTAVADVADSFNTFLNGASVATVGSLTVGAATPAVRLPNGTAAALAGVVDTESPGGVPNSTVTFMGDFSFANVAFLHGDDDCSTAGTDSTAPPDAAAAGDLLIRDSDDKVTDTTKLTAQNVTVFATARYLCIEVATGDDAPRIPSTGAYTAMGKYKAAVAGAVIGPKPMEQTLGMVKRNGTTIRVPFLTTYSEYNQRLVLVNRASEARYEIEFTPETGTTATPKSKAEGMLPTGTSMMLSRDIVSLSGKSTRTSAVIFVEAEPRKIDAATVTVNRTDGSSDTVTFTDNN